MEKKYNALRIIGTFYKVIGGIVGIVTILSAIGICATMAFGQVTLGDILRDYGVPDYYGLIGGTGVVGGLIISFVLLLYGGSLALTLFAMGEGIYLLIAVEQNTRLATELLSKQLNK